jgi:GTP-binding protein EngB required for normal cell division
MKISSRLSQIFLCINFEHGLKSSDIQFMQRADKFNVDIQIIMTKVDKVS